MARRTEINEITKNDMENPEFEHVQILTEDGMLFTMDGKSPPLVSLRGTILDTNFLRPHSVEAGISTSNFELENAEVGGRIKFSFKVTVLEDPYNKKESLKKESGRIIVTHGSPIEKIFLITTKKLKAS
ncbi:MAG: hypothetical protein ABII97_02945 [Patescibacteria group bacterium]